jgi:thiol:disulfide interchange protein DsbD
LGFVFLFTFAMGLGVLFLILGTFEHLLNRVPKSGPWMETVKFIFGTMMVGVAFYYIEPIYPPWLFDALLGLALLILASIYGAFEPSVPDSQILFRLRKGLMIALFAIGLVFLILGLLKSRGVTFAEATHNQAATSTHLAWQPYNDAKLASALAEHKPVIIDFSAEWCAACKELERDTFPDPEVRDLSQKFVLLEFDATNESAELNRLKQKFMIVGLPTLVFYDVHGSRRDQDLRLTGFEKPSAFLKRMQAALAL